MFGIKCHPRLTERKVFESLVCSAFHLKRYWRKGEKEIDFLKVNEKILPIEVKEKAVSNRKDTKTLLYFMKRYNIDKGGYCLFWKKKKL